MIPVVIKNLYKKHRHVSPGFIYMYQLDSGEYKIGRTRVGVKKRLKRWEKQFQKPLKLIARFYSTIHVLAENLIHLELKANDFWLEEVQNCVCKVKKHVELFTGSQEELIKCILFWVNYLN